MGGIKTAFFMAYKAIIKGNRWALVLIILVMSLSFANLILTPSLLSGVTDTLDEQQVDNLFANIVIDPAADDYYLERVGDIEKRVEQVPGVVGVAAHLNSSALIEYGWREKDSPQDRGIDGSWNIIGIDPGREVAVTAIHERIVQGSYLETGDRDEILLGIEIAGGDAAQTSSFLTLGGVRAGDRVRLTYANGIQREYRVQGIFQAREITQADHLAFVTREEMVSVLGRSAYHDRASQVLVKIEPAGAEGRIIAELGSLGIAGEVRSWREYGGAVGGIVSSFDVMASLIGGIGLVVAAIVMFIVIYINVLHKRRQIGILRAIGVRTRIIMGSYLIQALFYSTLGVICGGLFFGFGLQPYFSMHPLDLPLGPVSLAIRPEIIRNAVIGLILAAALAGLVPVLSVVRQSIVRAIWRD